MSRAVASEATLARTNPPRRHGGREECQGPLDELIVVLGPEDVDDLVGKGIKAHLDHGWKERDDGEAEGNDLARCVPPKSEGAAKAVSVDRGDGVPAAEAHAFVVAVAKVVDAAGRRLNRTRHHQPPALGFGTGPPESDVAVPCAR